MASKVRRGSMQKKLESEFGRLKDPEDAAGLMNAAQIEAFGTELGIDIYTQPEILYISYLMGATVQGEYTKDQFVQGLTKLGVDSVAALKTKLPDIRAAATEPEPEFYKWVYGFCCEQHQKTISLETLVELMPMVLPARKWPLVPSWLKFLQTQTRKSISRDTWVQFLRFMKTVKPDMSNYDEEAAWPVTIDDFVQWFKAGAGGSAGGAGSAGGGAA